MHNALMAPGVRSKQPHDPVTRTLLQMAVPTCVGCRGWTSCSGDDVSSEHTSTPSRQASRNFSRQGYGIPSANRVRGSRAPFHHPCQEGTQFRTAFTQDQARRHLLWGFDDRFLKDLPQRLSPPVWAAIPPVRATAEGSQDPLRWAGDPAMRPRQPGDAQVVLPGSGGAGLLHRPGVLVREQAGRRKVQPRVLHPAKLMTGAAPSSRCRPRTPGVRTAHHEGWDGAGAPPIASMQNCTNAVAVAVGGSAAARARAMRLGGRRPVRASRTTRPPS